MTDEQKATLLREVGEAFDLYILKTPSLSVSVPFVVLHQDVYDAIYRSISLHRYVSPAKGS